MKQRVLAAAVLGAVAWVMATPVDAWAFGKKNKCSDSGQGYWPVCPPPCASATGPGASVQYVQQTVTRYRPVVQTRQVPVTRMQMVPQTQTYTYHVNVPVTTTEKRQVTEYQQT